MFKYDRISEQTGPSSILIYFAFHPGNDNDALTSGTDLTMVYSRMLQQAKRDGRGSWFVPSPPCTSDA